MRPSSSQPHWSRPAPGPKRRKKSHGFALYEVLIGLTIFVVGVLALGRSMENCMNASVLSAQEDRVRQILANRMAEVQATPGAPEETREIKFDTGYGEVKVKQRSVPSGLKGERDTELNGISRVTLTAEWARGGVAQSREVQFYVYRAG